MRQALIKKGSVVIEHVPDPKVSKKNILVKVKNSCISAGTEIESVRLSAMPIYQRALKQPENVKKVLDSINREGLQTTYKRVSGILSSGTPTGYSASGVIIEVGEDVEDFQIGDKVACAGAGIANHAELIDVPVNLSVKIPEKVSFKHASTVTLGSIALQGIRRLNPSLGETYIVVGLGILGQITSRALLANGCKVIGVDIDKSRTNIALKNGINCILDPNQSDYLQKINIFTQGIGADGVIITAASKSSEIISQSMNSCRKKGKVVIVGDIGLDLKRSDFYKKELDLLISCSYGPGRYDPFYEEDGQDYPFPYVRWTENRNMQAYMELLNNGQINLETIPNSSFKIENVTEAYSSINSKEQSKILTFLDYDEDDKSNCENKIFLDSNFKSKNNVLNICLVGTSSFAQGVHLPNIAKLKDKFKLRAVMTKTPSNSLSVSKRYSAEYCTCDYNEILKDENIDLILIANRPNLHGSMVLKALESNKNVFVEKPLTIFAAELKQIKKILKNSSNLLMVGFNRRFSPPIKKLKSLLKNNNSPIIINYSMNAGFFDRSHWMQGKENGSRNLSEACHIYDLFNYLVGSISLESVSANSINPNNKVWKSNDNFVSTIKYRNGSLCNLIYTSLGSAKYPKERLEIFTEGKVYIMENYLNLKLYNSKMEKLLWSSKIPQKGQLDELKALADCLINGNKLGLSHDEIIQATEIAFSVEEQIKS